MSKFQIEKVDHTPIDEQTCCVTSYYRVSDTLLQSNFYKEENALLAKNSCTTGLWRIKSLKNK